MTITKTFVTPEGREISVGSSVCSRAEILVPVETARSLTAIELGELVQSMCGEADLMYCHEMAYLYPEDYLKGAQDEELFSLQQSLDAIDTIDEEIISLKERVARLATGRRRRAEHRLGVAGRRRQFAKSRDRLFMETGNRDGFVCCGCGAVQDLTMDHITPLIEGGTDDIDNLQLLCRTCNSRKGAR